KDAFSLDSIFFYFAVSGCFLSVCVFNSVRFVGGSQYGQSTSQHSSVSHAALGMCSGLCMVQLHTRGSRTSHLPCSHQCSCQRGASTSGFCCSPRSGLHCITIHFINFADLAS
uniref:Uncharacterized protein n=1 Tax=Scleropages formosus TaxID=113540 RepID=A0A8C9QZA4_SCLFO